MHKNLSRAKLRLAFERAAETYDESAVLQREVAERMLMRLDLIKLNPSVIVDAGSGTGYCTRSLAGRYRGARVYAVDISHAMSRRAADKAGWFSRQRFVCGDAEALPLATASVDLLLSNLMLQWCDPEAVFTEFFRVLRPGGLLMFSSFGPDTLRELRAAWGAVDGAAHVHDFIDMHDLGDVLVHTRFADPVMDMEYFNLTYPDVMAVLRELKHLGASNAAVGRPGGLTGKSRFQRFTSAYRSSARNERIPATYEVVYGHAWVPEAKPQSRASAPAEIAVPLSQFRRRSP